MAGRRFFSRGASKGARRTARCTRSSSPACIRRLKPKTLPGQVYATEAFTARAALEGHASFRCTFTGQLEFDKHYGMFPGFVVTRDCLGQLARKFGRAIPIA
jgi:hypothetical protein